MNCEECEEEIPEKRLKAKPDAKLCVRCQERHDRKVQIRDVFDSLANNEWEGW